MNLQNIIQNQNHLNYLSKIDNPQRDFSKTDIRKFSVLDNYGSTLGSISDLVIDTNINQMKYAEIELDTKSEPYKSIVGQSSLIKEKDLKLVPTNYLTIDPYHQTVKLDENTLFILLEDELVGEHNRDDNVEINSKKTNNDSGIEFKNEERRGILSKGFIKGKENYTKKNYTTFNTEVK